jgi:hypothetical protein
MTIVNGSVDLTELVTAAANATQEASKAAESAKSASESAVKAVEVLASPQMSVDTEAKKWLWRQQVPTWLAAGAVVIAGGYSLSETDSDWVRVALVGLLLLLTALVSFRSVLTVRWSAPDLPASRSATKGDEG